MNNPVHTSEALVRHAHPAHVVAACTKPPLHRLINRLEMTEVK